MYCPNHTVKERLREDRLKGTKIWQKTAMLPEQGIQIQFPYSQYSLLIIPLTKASEAIRISLENKKKRLAALDPGSELRDQSELCDEESVGAAE